MYNFDLKLHSLHWFTVYKHEFMKHDSTHVSIIGHSLGGKADIDQAIATRINQRQH